MPVGAPLIDANEAARRVRSGEAWLLDVREPWELELARVPGALHVPMREVDAANLPRDRPLLVLCHHGYRSQRVADALAALGVDAANVAGGIAAWADEVDEGVGRY